MEASASLPAQFRACRVISVVAIVSSGSAIALGIAAFTRQPAAAPAAAPLPTELTLQRLNIVEPDGTPRMIIASRARFPGSFVEGKEIARPDRGDEAGILFVNDEGTENGGFIQSGKLGKDGKVEAGLSLTFDRFRQDQVLQLLHAEDADGAGTSIVINDRPSYKVFSTRQMFDLIAAAEKLTPADREAAMKQHLDAGHFGAPRAVLGSANGTSRLELLDPKGNPRLRLRVDDKGEPAIELLDAAGKVVRELK